MMEALSYLANKLALHPNVEPIPTFARGLGGSVNYVRPVAFSTLAVPMGHLCSLRNRQDGDL
jgi:hypothetical protein